jgi:hypothetical protein
MSKIFIPGNTPSLKNSKVATANGVFMSKTVRKYLQKLGVRNYSVSKKTYENYKTRPNLFDLAVVPMRNELQNKKLPHVIGLHFIRGTRHKADYINLAQVICDLLVAHGGLFDDDMDHLIPTPYEIDGRWYSYDKDNPGVIIDY